MTFTGSSSSSTRAMPTARASCRACASPRLPSKRAPGGEGERRDGHSRVDHDHHGRVDRQQVQQARRHRHLGTDQVGTARDPRVEREREHTRPEDGGLYLFGEYVMFHQTNPLSSGQPIAVRGFYVWDTSLGPSPASLVNSSVAIPILCSRQSSASE